MVAGGRVRTVAGCRACNPGVGPGLQAGADRLADALHLGCLAVQVVGYAIRAALGLREQQVGLSADLVVDRSRSPALSIGVESSEVYLMATSLGATGGRDGFRITPCCVTSTRAAG